MIKAVLYDVGGTLHTIEKTDGGERFCGLVIERLRDYGIELPITKEALAPLLHANAEAYKAMTEKTLRELPQANIWNDWYLRDFSIGRERLAPIAEELSFLYDYARLKLKRRDGMTETLARIHELGYRQGIISNIISNSFVPHILNEYGIAGYMSCVLCSQGVGMRKPDPAIFRLAAERLELAPRELCYVGDTISRDLIGARRAELGAVVLIDNPAVAHRDAKVVGYWEPDARIHTFSELLPLLGGEHTL